MTIKEVLEHKWLQKFCSKNNDTVLKRRKSRDLSGGEQFKIYATLLEDEIKYLNIFIKFLYMVKMYVVYRYCVVSFKHFM